MKSFEIYWYDLSPEAQKRLIAEGFDPHDNINLTPLAIIDVADENEAL